MNIHNYLLWSEFLMKYVWDSLTSQPEIPFHHYNPSGVRTSNMSSCQDDSRHRVRWETHAGWLVKSKKIQDWIHWIWRGPIAGPLEISCTEPLSHPCPALPACVLWNFNWIVNDTEEWHNTWETSKNQSGGALFLTVTKQKTLGNWQVQAARPE